MIGQPEIQRIVDSIPALPDVLETSEAWQIDLEALAKISDRFATEAANRVMPLGPLTPYEALYTMFLSGIQMGYLMRNELELQKEAVT